MKSIKQIFVMNLALMFCGLAHVHAADNAPAEAPAAKTEQVAADGGDGAADGGSEDLMAQGVWWNANCECSDGWTWRVGSVRTCADAGAGGPVLDILLNAKCSNLCAANGMQLVQWAFSGLGGACQY